MAAPRKAPGAAREGGHRPVSPEKDPRPDSVRARLTLAPSTVLKTVATLSDPPPAPRRAAKRKKNPVTTTVLPDLPLSALATDDLRQWARQESRGDLERIEVHSPWSVTVHNSAGMKAQRRAERVARQRTGA